ncbi:MAG TPA: NAD-dependent epimerase/dehydratase family protein [Burkholderiales bacterium]|nr:NAD-dependent epimerase/dehydratase family protein [Burkholderiales bacterium]
MGCSKPDGEAPVIRIGITGIEGLIGWHLRCFFKPRGEFQVIPANRATFASAVALQEFVGRCDVVIHLAGANRGPDQDVAAANIALTTALIEACDAADVTPHIIFSSSTHIFRGTAYGASKIACSDRFRAWADRTGAIFSNLVLPNVFGEHGKPFYNSVVSTFCHQLALALVPEVKADATLEFVHCHEIGLFILDLIQKKTDAEIILPGRSMSISGLLARLTEFDHAYKSALMPHFSDAFDLALFNTYRSYLYPQHYPVVVPLNTDQRGTLFETVKSLNGGQTFVSTTKPGVTRGNHFHFHKVERFFVLSGEAVIRLRRLFSDEVREFPVSSGSPCFIDMPSLHTHNITNTGDSELITMFWAHEIFDRERPDTYQEMVAPA